MTIYDVGIIIVPVLQTRKPGQSELKSEDAAQTLCS